MLLLGVLLAVGARAQSPLQLQVQAVMQARCGGDRVGCVSILRHLGNGHMKEAFEELTDNASSQQKQLYRAGLENFPTVFWTLLRPSTPPPAQCDMNIATKLVTPRLATLNGYVHSIQRSLNGGSPAIRTQHKSAALSELLSPVVSNPGDFGILFHCAGYQPFIEMVKGLVGL